MSKNLTAGGITLLIIGGIMVLIGLLLFFSVFFNMSSGFSPGQDMTSGFPSGFQSVGTNTGPNFSSAVIGIILAGIGGLLIKVGLGMSIIGSSDKIANWAGERINTVKQAANEGIICPECNTTNKKDSRYCNNCGGKL